MNPEQEAWTDVSGRKIHIIASVRPLSDFLGSPRKASLRRANTSVLEGFLDRHQIVCTDDDHDLMALSVEKACENMLCWVIGRDSAI